MPAAPASRAVLSVTYDEATGQYRAACTRCEYDERYWDAVRFLAAVVGHEEGHAPASGVGVQVFQDVRPDAAGYAVIPHDLGRVTAVDVVTGGGERVTFIGPPHIADYGTGDVEVLLPAGDGPFEVWLHGAPGS